MFVFVNSQLTKPTQTLSMIKSTIIENGYIARELLRLTFEINFASKFSIIGCTKTLKVEIESVNLLLKNQLIPQMINSNGRLGN